MGAFRVEFRVVRVAGVGPAWYTYLGIDMPSVDDCGKGG